MFWYFRSNDFLYQFKYNKKIYGEYLDLKEEFELK